MDKRFLGFLVLVVVVLGGFFFISNAHKASDPGSSGGTLTNHVLGTSSTGVVLTEYGDYQCPACGSYYAPVKQVTEKYSGIVSFQFRNFPLFQIHPNAIAGARAAEAADMQAKYWAMHDLLYENQSAWSTISDPQPAFEAYAKQLGINITKFQTDYKSASANNRIQADLKEGNRLAIQSTPSFFLDGKKISNPDPTVEAFSKVIDVEIAKKSPASTSQTQTPGQTPTPAAAAPAAPASGPSGQ